MHHITSPEVVKSQFDGQHQRQCTTTSTPVPLMCGAMAVYSMRYGALDDYHSRDLGIHR